MSDRAGLVHATLDKLTAWLGAAPHQQDVVYSEASARKALSRRDFLRTAGAVAAGVVLADRVVEAVRAKDQRLLAHDSGAAEGYELRMVAYSQFVNRHPAYIMASTPVYALPRHGFAVWELEPGITASDYIFRRGDAIEVFRSQPGVAEYSYGVDSEPA